MTGDAYGTVRFYVRNADGSVEDDETCVIDVSPIFKLEKGFSIMGEPKTWVVEFDPPLTAERITT